MLIEPRNLSPLSPQIFTRHFLIIPIFFQKNIQAVFASGDDETTLGFLFGSEKENYRIVKRIWPVHYGSSQPGWHRKDTIYQLYQTPEVASLPLLGCFHTGPLSLFLDNSEIAELTDRPFSDIRISYNRDKTLRWQSKLIQPDLTTISETVLL